MGKRLLRFSHWFVLAIAIAEVPAAHCQFGGRADASRLQGRPISQTAPTDTYVLTWDAATGKWAPAVGGGGAPTNATYITQTANGTLSAEQAMGSLGTGLVKNTTTTGVQSIAVAADVIALWSGTCNSSTLLAGDGTCAAVSSAFSAITAGTNANALVVGSGGSLGVSGTGTIVATTVTGFSPASGKVLTLSNSITQTATDSSTVAFGAGGTVLYNGGALGTPSSVNLSNATALPDSALSANVPLLNATNAFTGSDSFSKALTLSGTLTPTALSGDVNNYNPTNCATSLALRIDGGAADRNITGLQCAASAPSDGRIITIVNIGTTNNLVLKNQSGSSSAANQFLLPADTSLPINTALALRYDGTSSVWRPWSRALSNTGVTAGTYGSVTVDVAGRVTAGSTTTPLANGGTNAALTASNGGIFYSTASAGAILAGTATAGLALLSGASTTPTWSASAPALVGAANSFSAAQTVTVNGALSAPGLTATGTWIATGGTATTTKPYVLIEPAGATSAAWSTLGTGLGVNAASGFCGSGVLADFQANGSSKFKFDCFGNATINNTVIVPIVTSAANSLLTLNNSAYSNASVVGTVLTTGTFSQTSGTNAAVKIAPTYNQASGTAANTDLLINRTETAVGSGAQQFVDMQVGGTSKFSINHLGNVTIVPQASSSGTRYLCIDTTGAVASSASACSGT